MAARMPSTVRRSQWFPIDQEDDSIEEIQTMISRARNLRLAVTRSSGFRCAEQNTMIEKANALVAESGLNEVAGARFEREAGTDAVLIHGVKNDGTAHATDFKELKWLLSLPEGVTDVVRNLRADNRYEPRLAA
jgi:hypothetical protein